MPVTTETLPASRARLLIDVPEDVVSQAKVKAAVSLSSRLKIPGFRAGKAPESVVRSQVGERAFLDEVVEETVQATYPFAVKESGIRVVARPEKVELLSFEPFRYEVVVAVHPDIDLGSYRKISVALPPVEITDADVDKAIADILASNATYAPVEREARQNDRIRIDFSARDAEGKPVPGTEGEGEFCTLGEGRYVPGFEEALVGIKADESRTFPITFPKDYRAQEMAGKTVEFTVRATHVEERKLPELDDAFVTTLGGGKPGTVEQFRAEVRSNMLSYRLEQERKQAEEKVMDKLLSTCKGDVPEALVSEERGAMLEDLRSELRRAGTDLERYLRSQDKTVDALMQEWEKPARDRVRLRFILRAIIEKEGLAVTDGEIDAEVESMLSSYHEEFRAKARDLYRPGQPARDNLANRLEVRKVFDLFITTPAA